MENSNNRYKFRAWDKDKKELREVTRINWYDECIWVDETPMSGDKLPVETTPILQSTGLKDCKGNDVYESDIVMVDSYEFFKCKEVDVIEFRRGGFYVGNGDDFSSLSNVADMNGVLRGEVVGNLYENPELLKAKD